MKRNRIDLSLHIHNDFNVQQLFNIVTQSRTGSEQFIDFSSWLSRIEERAD